MKDCNVKCQMLTNYGEKCQFKAVIYNRDIDKCLCGIHNKVVKQIVKKWRKLLSKQITCGKKTKKRLYKEYVAICKSKRKCNNKFSNDDLIEMIKIMETCRDKRLQFTDKCYKDIGDSGHEEQINQVQNAIDNCYYVLNKRKK